MRAKATRSMSHGITVFNERFQALGKAIEAAESHSNWLARKPSSNAAAREVSSVGSSAAPISSHDNRWSASARAVFFSFDFRLNFELKLILCSEKLAHGPSSRTRCQWIPFATLSELDYYHVGFFYSHSASDEGIVARDQLSPSSGELKDQIGRAHV